MNNIIQFIERNKIRMHFASIHVMGIKIRLTNPIYFSFLSLISLFFPLIVSYFGFNSRKKNLAKVPKLNNNGKVVIIMILALSFLPCVLKKYFCNNRQTKLQTRGCERERM